jgi:SAM-dependent methyltransferase
MFLENEGYCNCCEQNTTFASENGWLRDFYICCKCGSIPRERALMFAIERYCPNWPNLVIHESSPVERGASLRLKRSAGDYISSQYFPGIESGVIHNGVRCENLENMSFANASIDLHVTQDVFEHLFFPDKALSEISRTLRPGGMIISTIPLENKEKPTQIMAELEADGTIQYFSEPVYHGNPVSDKGALVTRKWGYDIVDFIYKSSGLISTIMYVDK